jgi:hypothetical protein
MPHVANGLQQHAPVVIHPICCTLMPCSEAAVVQAEDRVVGVLPVQPGLHSIPQVPAQALTAYLPLMLSGLVHDESAMSQCVSSIHLL